MKKPTMKKVRHDKALRIEHEGEVWTIDAAEWRNGEIGQLRVYAIHGSVTSPNLVPALELEAASRGLAVSL